MLAATLKLPDNRVGSERLRGDSKKVTEPLWWRSSRYNNPLQPVVGISLYEAMAYRHWLSEVAGESFTLPNELQWEAAARGQTKKPRIYAWGNTFVRDVCNSRDEQEKLLVGTTTPIGLYELGKTPDTDLYDMTGNVWEWTSSAYHEKPPYDISPLLELADAAASRVVRGGSWLYIQRHARAACRNVSLPDYRYYSLGCRVCLASPLKF